MLWGLAEEAVSLGAAMGMLIISARRARYQPRLSSQGIYSMARPISAPAVPEQHAERHMSYRERALSLAKARGIARAGLLGELSGSAHRNAPADGPGSKLS